MSAVTSTLHIKGFPRRKLHALAQRAKRAGMTPERYVKRLVEDDLAISEEARTKTFAQIMDDGTARPMADEDDIDRLVEKAKEEHHARMAKKKR